MERALRLAETAVTRGQRPFGAVIGCEPCLLRAFVITRIGMSRVVFAAREGDSMDTAGCVEAA